MASARSLDRLSMPTAVVVVALLATFVALALIDTGLAIVVAIFAFIFGGDVVRGLVSTADGEVEDDLEEQADDHGSRTEALERLRTRYAEGELSDAEFERKLETLLATETVTDVERHLEHRGEERSQGDRELERSTE